MRRSSLWQTEESAQISSSELRYVWSMIEIMKITNRREDFSYFQWAVLTAKTTHGEVAGVNIMCNAIEDQFIFIRVVYSDNGNHACNTLLAHKNMKKNVLETDRWRHQHQTTRFKTKWFQLTLLLLRGAMATWRKLLGQQDVAQDCDTWLRWYMLFLYVHSGQFHL